ncbi:OLC1v1009122C1 [Oldenlandia corymbosa var. corymbosa]|uniref:OLC1v1009122C1 n=1 Tax=Oldenlandia corymbosa var. corymbosa TaxID=529605 RepID=A0AAV1DR02_OLDCO|nr:OLC1v1009122C1 [Oldenlandia corymbosa var. corymbosa]
MAETNQTTISVVEPEGFVETVNENAVDNPIVIPSEDVIATPPNDVGVTGIPILAAQRYIVDINGLIDTKSNHFTIVVKVMTLWEVPEVSKKNKVNSVEMCLIDAQGSKIQATIPGRIVKDFANSFKEGCVRRLSRFDSCLNISEGFRCAKHEYKIVFMLNTNVEAAFDFDIPDHVFEFTPLAEVTNFVANFDYCFGHIMAYSDPIVENGKKRISVELKDERADKLKVTLWGEHAYQVTKYMSNNPPSPVVLIVQYVKCKKYYSKVSVTTNLFNGKIYLDDMAIPDISEYKDRSSGNEMKAASIQKISMLLHGSGYTSYEEFINGAKLLLLGDIDDLDEVGYVVIFGKITGLAKEYEWSYIGCRDCNKKVEEIEKEKAGKDYPKILDEIVGKKCLFRLDVSRYNIRNSSSEISVARLTIDAEIIKKYIDNVSEDHTAVSCTGDTEIGNLADDMADSPPTKNKSAGSCGEEFGVSSRSKINFVYHRSLNVLQLFYFNYDGCERIHPDVNTRTGNRYLLRLDHAKCVDVKRNQWEFMIMKENNEPVGFEGRAWEEFHDYYYNRIKCVNVIVIYTGNLYFHLRLFNNEGYCCNLYIVDSDTSEGEVDTVDYLCSNGDPNTFSAVMTDTVIHHGRLEIPWHIVRRLKLDDYTNAILYYNGVPVINMHRAVTNDNPHQFVIEGDIKYMVDLKKISLENFIMVNSSAKEARLFRKDLLKAKRLSLQSRRRNKQTVVISTVQINDAVNGKDARFTRK